MPSRSDASSDRTEGTEAHYFENCRDRESQSKDRDAAKDAECSTWMGANPNGDVFKALHECWFKATGCSGSIPWIVIVRKERPT